MIQELETFVAASDSAIGLKASGLSAGAGPSAELVTRIYESMVRTRLIDDRMVLLQRQGRVGFHVGARGEEACIVAAAAALSELDWIFPCYREIGALLWRGFPLQEYLDNMYGNAADTVHGRQMPDHYTGKAYRFASVSSPIGTQLTQAVGVAWASKKRREASVTAVFFGDGATSSSDFHSALTFAGVFKTPNVFLCRNNGWAISIPSAHQTASANLAVKASAYGIQGVQCDGNDALAVYAAVQEARAKALRGEGATLIEMVTYRLGGHSTSDDPSIYRPRAEVEQWEGSDPLRRLRLHLEAIGDWNEQLDSELCSRIEAELRQCIKAAEAKPAPALETLFEGVYGETPAFLKEQYAECASAPRPQDTHR